MLVPWLKVPERVKIVPDVPSKVMVEALAFRVPAVHMFKYPEFIEWLLPFIVSKVEVPDVLPDKVMVPVEATSNVPARFTVRVFEEAEVGFTVKLPFT